MLKFILDAILVIVVLIGLFAGLKKGFVGIIARPVKFVASLGLAFAFCKSVAAKFIVPYIGGPIANYVKDFLYKNCSNITADSAAEELPTLLKMAAGMFDINIDEVATNATGAIVEALADKLTSPVIEIVSIILGFIGIFIVANILLAIVLALVNLVFKAGVLGIFNKLMGVIFGIAFALIISWGIAIAFNFVVNVPAISELAWAKEFEGGFIYNLLNKYNPIELLLSF